MLEVVINFCNLLFFYNLLLFHFMLLLFGLEHLWLGWEVNFAFSYQVTHKNLDSNRVGNKWNFKMQELFSIDI